MLGPRVLTSLVGLPLILFASYYGGAYLAFLVLAIVVIAAVELAAMLEHGGVTVSRWVVVLAAGAFPVLVHFRGEQFFDLTFFLLLAGSALYMVLLAARQGATTQVLLGGMILLWGTIYVGWSLSFLLALRELSFASLLVAFLAAFAHDTLAFFVGRSFGRHKLAPRLSPNKTVEGAVGGLSGSVFAVVAMQPWLGISPGQALVLGILAGLSALLGDLTESALKRGFSVKDSGKVLPGHGGILDRFDGVIMTAPLIYIFLLNFTAF